MRKNGINRELREIEGGVCAPEGYMANAVACGIKEEGLDFALIFTKKRCAVACVYATGKRVGAPIAVSKRNMRNGYARAILVNGGIANAVQEDGEKLAFSVCDLLFPYGVERGETVIASTGYMGERLCLSNFQAGIKPLWEGLGSSPLHSHLVAEAIKGEDSPAKELSYSFDLGDYPCKIGVVFKGGRHICPNMATFLAFITTDVNISTPMLQKALTAEVKETLNQLNIDVIPSPNDTVCIMANGQAGNYKITATDAEYKKFAFALRAVLTEACKATAKEDGKLFTCKVKGAISKEVARSIAKTLVGATTIKEALKKGKVDIGGIVSTALSVGNAFHAERLEIGLSSALGEVVVYQGEYALYPSKETLDRILGGEEISISLHLREGNYGSTAFGRW